MERPINPDRLQRVYTFLRGYQRQNRYAPTLREVAQGAACCLQSAHDALRYLVGQDVIAHRPGVRGYYIPGEPHQFRGDP